MKKEENKTNDEVFTETEESEVLEKTKDLNETSMTIVDDFSKPITSGSRQRIQSTITDPKILFNLDEHIDFKLNDMEGKEINVVDIVIKSFEKDIPERVNEFTGELETVERSIVTILVDDTGTSYVTASKMFAMRVIKLIQTYRGNIDEIHKGVKIRITKTPHKNGNKKLGFELV